VSQRRGGVEEQERALDDGLDVSEPLRPSALEDSPSIAAADERISSSK